MKLNLSNKVSNFCFTSLFKMINLGRKREACAIDLL